MIKASSYILRNMSAMLGELIQLEKNEEPEPPELETELSSIKDSFDKYCKRYQNDEELQVICNEFEDYLRYKDNEIMGQITKELDELIYIRKLETMVKQLRIKGQERGIISLT